MDNIIFYRGKNVALALPPKPQILSNEPADSSKYIQIRRVRFKENEKIKTWDIAKLHNSVAILLYDFKMKGFIFVRQFRISVYLRNENHGYVYELCAGLCDKDGKSEKQVALEEMQEECGYFIDDGRLECVADFYSSVGINGTLQSIFYAEICENDRKAQGGGNANESEDIEIIFVPLHLIDEFLSDESCPKAQSLCYAVMWYKLNKLG